MPTTVIGAREVCAEGSRPGAILDQAARAVDAVAGTVSRWLWIRAYEAAEARYWPAGEKINNG